MILHKYIDPPDMTNYALFDRNERLVEYPTNYLRSLRRHRRSPESQRHIANVLKLHCQWIERNPNFDGFHADQVMQNLISEDTLDWIDDQREEGRYESTINNREVLAREFYRWLTTAEGGRVRNDIPWGSKTFTKRSHSNLPRFVTMEQVIRLLNATHNESQRVAFHFMYDTGLRVSELVRMTNDILPNESDWPEDVNYYPLLVPGSKGRDGRRFKYRYTIVSRPMLARVRRYHSSTGYLFAKYFSLYDAKRATFLNVHGQRLSIDSVQKAITAAWVRQGGATAEMSPHRLRHGTALSILQSEFGDELLDNLLILKSMLGHANIRTTEAYTAIPINAIRSMLNGRKVRIRYDEAQQIFDATYLPEHSHAEKRGRRK